MLCDAPLDEPVRWVHVSDVADLSNLLQGGELVLTTGRALRRAHRGRYLAVWPRRARWGWSSNSAAHVDDGARRRSPQLAEHLDWRSSRCTGRSGSSTSPRRCTGASSPNSTRRSPSPDACTKPSPS